MHYMVLEKMYRTPKRLYYITKKIQKMPSITLKILILPDYTCFFLHERYNLDRPAENGRKIYEADKFQLLLRAFLVIFEGLNARRKAAIFFPCTHYACKIKSARNVQINKEERKKV